MLHGIRKAALEKVVPRGTRSRPKAQPPARLSDEVMAVPASERDRHSLENSRRAGAQGKKQPGSCVIVDPEKTKIDNAGCKIIQALKRLNESWTHKHQNSNLSNVLTWSLDIVGPGAHVMNVTYFHDGYPAVAKRYVVVYKRIYKIDDPEFDPLANDAPIDRAVVKAMNEEAHAVRAGTLIQPTGEIADEPVPDTGTGNNDPSSNDATNELDSAGSPDVEETDDDATEVLVENEVVADAYDGLENSDDDVFVAPLADDDDTVISPHQPSPKTGTDLDGAPETVNATIDSSSPVNDSMNFGGDSSSSTNARFQWLQKRNVRLQTELALKDSNYESLKETLHVKSAEVVTLKEKLRDIESKALKLEQNLEACDIKLVTKEEELTLSRAENIELKHDLQTLHETLNSKEKELEAKNIEASNLGQELKAVQVQIAEASGSSKSNAENENPVLLQLADGEEQAKIDSLKKELAAMEASAKREKRKLFREFREEMSKRMKCQAEIARLEMINFELKCNKEKGDT